MLKTKDNLVARRVLKRPIYFYGENVPVLCYVIIDIHNEKLSEIQNVLFESDGENIFIAPLNIFHQGSYLLH